MKNRSSLVSPAQLSECTNDPNLVILDGSWYLPGQQRNPYREYQDRHIPGARYFDIDRISDQETELPHMIPSEGYFSQSVQELGISNSSKIVVYDGAGLFSAARVWWLFRAFGHADIAILDGGLPAWIEKGFEVTNVVTVFQPGNFTAELDSSLFTSVEDMRGNCRSRHYTVLDARSGARYRGEAPEPRPELPSGHMPGSTSLPFTDLVSDGSLKPGGELQKIFANAGVAAQTPVITSCGSGVTAAVITLALENCGFGLQKLYDGSWTEWASGNDNPIVTGQQPG